MVIMNISPNELLACVPFIIFLFKVKSDNNFKNI